MNEERRKLLMIAHAYYPSDPRVRREALAALEAGFAVDVVCLRLPSEVSREFVEGIGVQRLPVRRHRSSGLGVYLVEYVTFFLLALVRTARLQFMNRYSIVQVHTIPDFLVFAAAIPKLFGARVILDMHELMPEFFAAKTGVGGSHPAIRGIRLVEAFSRGFADLVLTVNDTLKETLVGRGQRPERLGVIMNSPDESIFRHGGMAGDRVPHDGFVLVYHGLLSETYDLETVVKGLKLAHDRGATDIRLKIVGGGPAREGLGKLAAELGLAGVIEFVPHCPIQRIPTMLASCDAGVTPLRRDCYADFCFSTKLLECVLVGMPVVAARSRTMLRYFGGDSVLSYEPGNAGQVAEAVMNLRNDGNSARRRADAAMARIQPLRWTEMKERYARILNELAKK